MKVKEVLPYLIEKLSLVEDIEYAKREALEILAHLLEIKPLDVYLNLDKEVASEEIEKILQARLERKPLPYIFKKAYFWGRPFYIEEGVLIPRQDTEVLVEVFLQIDLEEGWILELGCGSGIIAITLLLECPKLRVVAIDQSPLALKITQFNAIHYGVYDRLYLVRADWLNSLKKGPHFDVIVSNPPYLSEEEWQELDLEVKLYEPKLALVAGKEGTEYQESLLKEGANYLKEDGFLIFEMGYNQSPKIAGLAKKFHWTFNFYRDLQNYERVALLWKRKESISLKEDAHSQEQ